MPRGDSYQLQGQQGGTAYVSGDGAVTGQWRWLHFPVDTVFSNLEGNIAGIANLEGITFPAGTGLGGQFTALTVTSGVVVAYDA